MSCLPDLFWCGRGRASWHPQAVSRGEVLEALAVAGLVYCIGCSPLYDQMETQGGKVSEVVRKRQCEVDGRLSAELQQDAVSPLSEKYLGD